MEALTKQIKILAYRPHQVVFENCNNGQVTTVPRGRFERRYDLGFYEVLNPEVLPHVI